MKPENFEELVLALYDGLVEFDYYKQNGEIRHAIGTLNTAYIASALDDVSIVAEDKEIEPNVNPNYLNYFDIEKRQTRTCCINNIVYEKDADGKKSVTLKKKHAHSKNYEFGGERVYEGDMIQEENGVIKIKEQ